MKPFPWDAAIAYGIGRLRLAPRTFWALTPREFAALLPRRGSAPARDDLAALMRAFPDRKEHSDG